MEEMRKKEGIPEEVEVKVDLIKFCEAFKLPYEANRREDYSSDYETMSLSGQQIKEFLDKGISIKIT